MDAGRWCHPSGERVGLDHQSGIISPADGDGPHSGPYPKPPPQKRLLCGPSRSSRGNLDGTVIDAARAYPANTLMRQRDPRRR